MKASRQKSPGTVWFHLYKMSRIGKSTETESTLILAKSWGKEKGSIEKDWWATNVSFWCVEAILWWIFWWWLHNFVTKTHWAVCSATFVHDLNSFMILEMTTFMFQQKRWLRLRLSPNAEFSNKNKILPNACVSEPNCSQMRTFVNWGTIVFLKG